MQIIDPEQPDKEKNTMAPVHRGRHYILTGLIVIGLGFLLIASRMGYPIPEWVFTWKVFLIGLGIFIGEKHDFHGVGWLLLMAIGGIFLLGDWYPDLSIRLYIWPVILIFLGVLLILRPAPSRQWRDHIRKNRRHWKHHYRQYTNERYAADYSGMHSSEDYLDCVSIFGTVNKNILSKNFKGGEATSIFGGTSVNLLQADIQGSIELDLTQIFGGCTLIIPPHWEIKSEIVNIFGGVDDRRPVENVNSDHTHVIILRGTSVFGGIEIKSFI